MNKNITWGIVGPRAQTYLLERPTGARLLYLAVAASLRGVTLGSAVVHVSQNKQTAGVELQGILAGLYLFAQQDDADSGNFIFPFAGMSVPDALYVHVTVEGTMSVCQGIVVLHYES